MQSMSFHEIWSISSNAHTHRNMQSDEKGQIPNLCSSHRFSFYCFLVGNLLRRETLVIRKLVGYCVLCIVHNTKSYAIRWKAHGQPTTIMHIYLEHLESNIENKTEIIDGNGVNALWMCDSIYRFWLNFLSNPNSATHTTLSMEPILKQEVLSLWWAALWFRANCFKV